MANYKREARRGSALCNKQKQAMTKSLILYSLHPTNSGREGVRACVPATTIAPAHFIVAQAARCLAVPHSSTAAAHHHNLLHSGSLEAHHIDPQQLASPAMGPQIALPSLLGGGSVKPPPCCALSTQSSKWRDCQPPRQGYNQHNEGNRDRMDSARALAGPARPTQKIQIRSLFHAHICPF